MFINLFLVPLLAINCSMRRRRGKRTRFPAITVLRDTKEKLDGMEMYAGETYEDVIGGLIEDLLSLNPNFRKSLENARKEIAAGKCVGIRKLK